MVICSALCATLVVSTPNRYNRLKGVDGPLFRGRYKAILVDNDEYLLQVSKYIHLNPLEAKMVTSLEAYSWSSYPAYIGKCKAAKWLTTDEIYGQLTVGRHRAKRYRHYVEDVESDEEVQVFYGKSRMPPVFGGKGFIAGIVKRMSGVRSEAEVARKDRLFIMPGLDEIVAKVATHYKVSPEELVTSRRGRGAGNFPRKVAMYVAQVRGQYRLIEIADYFGLSHYGGVSSAISAVTQMGSGLAFCPFKENRNFKFMIYTAVRPY